VPPRLAGIVLNLVVLAMMACATLMLGPAALGFHRYVILTGSMTGTYDRGSIVFDRPTPVSSLKVGDPITYSPPPGFTHQTRVTHRIWAVHRSADGGRVFKTKGDANRHPDAWTFTLNHAMQDRVVFHIPEVGYLFLLLSLRDFRIVLIGVPALFVGLIMLRGLWRDGGEEARRQKLAEQGWRALTEPGGGAVLPPLEAAPAAHLLPSRLDLRLRPVPDRSAPAPARRRPAGRSRAAHAPPLAPSASIATIRLRVAHRQTAHRARN
jgi:signal peptidase